MNRRERRAASARGKDVSSAGADIAQLMAEANGDLDGADKVERVHLAEALSYRALADEIRRAA